MIQYNSFDALTRTQGSITLPILISQFVPSWPMSHDVAIHVKERKLDTIASDEAYVT